MTARYTPVPASVDFPAMEHEILTLWEAEDTFGASLVAQLGFSIQGII